MGKILKSQRNKINASINIHYIYRISKVMERLINLDDANKVGTKEPKRGSFLSENHAISNK